MEETGLKIDDIDAAILSVNGNPYGKFPDVASYLKYILGGKSLSAFLKEALNDKLHDVHILITAKVMDGSLCLAEDEKGACLIGFCAKRIADKLTWMGIQCSPFEVPST